ncbi:MAG: hypothetical protein KKB66_18160 [Alphaproteobacteria bacterium]|nr:hypothetical protein [Alphaproteobacteria bacterium]MBU0803527.1 hypothetical protein [Alphaproteobacteria bacterium]MBU0874220.1 hypothetical protein [Alphaproteobacteria bacterium]MBU1402455.1 hypothetical protein [Alphaproteobacteria bacterium]MBU1593096.1 hypothetical protein [Alphaproteobacteria bacterium]
MRKCSNILLVVSGLVLCATASTNAADLSYGTNVDYCSVSGTSTLILTENMTDLKGEVVRLMDESVAVASSSEWVNSSRPAFVWASEAKIACGKAYGYLKTSYRDEDTLNKCECFHNRMVEYLN